MLSSNSELPMKNHSKQRFEFLALVFSLISLIVIFLMEYARGRFAWVTNNFLNSEFTFLAYPLIIIVASISPYLCGIVVIIRAIIIYRKAYRNLAISIGFGLLIISLPIIFSLINSQVSPFLRGYADRVKSQIDTDVLQNWATQAINKSYNDGTSVIEDVPTGIGTLTFRMVSIMPNKNNSQVHIRLLDGGHFIGYYGLSIGDKDFSCSDFQYPNGEQYPVADGICVWYGGD